MKISAQLTASQVKSLDEYVSELRWQGGSEVTHVDEEPYSDNRVCITVKCDNGFCYHNFMGKRGKIFENATGSW